MVQGLDRADALGTHELESVHLQASRLLMRRRYACFMVEGFLTKGIDANDHAFLTMGSVKASQDHHVQVK
jgi:hypothetical protein